MVVKRWLLVAIRRSQLIPTLISQIIQINGQPGILNVVEEKPQSIFSFEFVNERIEAVFAVVNPKKLKGIQL